MEIRIKGSLLLTSQNAVPGPKLPWVTFLFLTALFLAAQHDLFCSLTSGESFSTTADEFTLLVEQGSTVRRIAFFFLGIFAMARLLLTKRHDVTINGVLGWSILLFLSWAFLSLAWSETPTISSRRLVVFAIFWFGALAVSQRFSPREILLWVFFSTIAYLHIGLLAEITLGTFHPLTGGYRFSGTIHPNSQGVDCALLFIASLFLLASEKRWRHFMVLIACESLVFLFLTKSRTSLALALFAPLVYWCLTLPLSRKGLIFVCIGFFFCFLLLFWEYLLPALQHAILLGRKDSDTITLSGRIPLWEQMISYISKRPVQGCGYDCFWTSRHIAEVASEQDWPVTQAHSVYIDLCLELGLVGGVLYVIMLMSGIMRTVDYHRASSDASFAFLGVMLVFITLNGLLESIFVIPNYASFVSLLIFTRLGFSNQDKIHYEYKSRG
jgi:exopolysaccharide production protein ExoQ